MAALRTARFWTCVKGPYLYLYLYLRNPVQTCLNLFGICPSRGELNLSKNRARGSPPHAKLRKTEVGAPKSVQRGPRDMPKARVAAFEAALTDL